MKKLLLASITALLILMPYAGHAADIVYFRECDGYGAPTKKGDGIVSGSWLWGLAKSTEDIRRSKPLAFAENGVIACDKALADALLKPEFLMRKAHLLQAKAYHQVWAFRFDDALATLRLVDEISGQLSPELFNRGLGIGNQLLRSFIYIETKQYDAAEAELDSIEAKRAYSATIRRAVRLLRLRMDSSFDKELALLREVAHLDPQANIEGFLLAIETGKIDQALGMGAGIAIDRPKNRGNWTVEGDELRDYETIHVNAELAGIYAYTLAASGRHEDAAATMLHAREELSAAMVPPPPRPDGKDQRKSVVLDYQFRTVYGKKGGQALDLWDRLITLRGEVENLDLEELIGKIESFPKGSVPVLVDLLVHAERQPSGDRQAVVATILEKIAEDRRKRNAVDIVTLIQLFPRPEAPENQVKFKKAGDGMFLPENGFSKKRMDDDTDWTIRFTDFVASGPTVEEFALLSAAQITKDLGYDGFLIQSRRVLERTTHVSGMWVGSYTQNSGREAQLRIRVVHKSGISPELVDAQWRMLDPDEIIAALSQLPRR